MSSIIRQEGGTRNGLPAVGLKLDSLVRRLQVELPLLLLPPISWPHVSSVHREPTSPPLEASSVMQWTNSENFSSPSLCWWWTPSLNWKRSEGTIPAEYIYTCIGCSIHPLLPFGYCWCIFSFITHIYSLFVLSYTCSSTCVQLLCLVCTLFLSVSCFLSGAAVADYLQGVHSGTVHGDDQERNAKGTHFALVLFAMFPALCLLQSNLEEQKRQCEVRVSFSASKLSRHTLCILS